MRVPHKVWFTVGVLVATGALGQESTIEVEGVVINGVPIASPEIRSLVITLRLDRDHDQYLTQTELDAAIADIRRAAVQDQRRARTRSWLRQSRARTMSPGTMRDPSLRPRPADVGPTMPMLVGRDGSRLRELRSARRRVISAGYELSLVSEDFHRLFSHLPPEQRHALLEADVEGNNDGTVTLREFYSHNRRVFSSKTRFESDFGEEAYLEVLRLFGVL